MNLEGVFELGVLMVKGTCLCHFKACVSTCAEGFVFPAQYSFNQALWKHFNLISSPVSIYLLFAWFVIPMQPQKRMIAAKGGLVG